VNSVQNDVTATHKIGFFAFIVASLLSVQVVTGRLVRQKNPPSHRGQRN
jgi:hypothetical protein